MNFAVAQIACVVGDVPANVRKLRDFAERAKAGGADWIVFPEMSDTGYVMSVIREQAAPWSSGAVPELQSMARQLSLGIICGVSERTKDAIFNAQVVIDAGGAILGRYRKTHLFSPAPIEEDKCFTPGSELVTVDLGPLRLGLGICYDLRFPEFHRTLACALGANVLVISSAWPFPRVAHLRTLAVARAIENQSYVILANRVDNDNGITFCGHSAIIDPFGVTLATASPDREEILQAEISPATIATIRASLPVFQHRRAELYR